MIKSKKDESADEPVSSGTPRLVMYVIWSAVALVCSITALVSALAGDLESSIRWIVGVAVSSYVAGLLRP